MSKSVGIVAEYNPFHTGHKHQLDRLRELGFSYIAAAMSGSCVQRGQLALFSKFERTKMALCGGVDLVAEIPYPFSCRSAEGYAKAGMQTLKALGVDAISFGSESDDINLLYNIAKYLTTEDYKSRLKAYLSEKIPFASAREKAIFERFDIKKDIVSASNDILAIEYIKACIEMGWEPEIIPVKRKGAAYNATEGKDGFSSAGGIRKMISEYRTEAAAAYIPKECVDIFYKNLDMGSYFLSDSAFEKSVLFSLSQKTAEDFILLPDCNEELANSFEKAASVSDSIDSLFDYLPTKRYTRARLSRIILAAFLNIHGDIPKDIQYIRILGFGENGENFVKKAASNCPLPFSHSAKILSEKSDYCKKIVNAESLACDAQAVFCKISQPPRADFTTKIIK